ncbi:MAG: hypothetical protein A2Z24_00245 [Candidatus Woykebacteria bacterium RBG_16_44_10]|uniref:Uncharacterized protein n=1 Tax=Candidatus Woykebacteria bacterium RBG_16_44_10 TaxID=1802597 RepID=A0A1G1WF32_9BACT|nr:MAG: hypothetical protein A2Z24_00245 [Candidatus Woykebacteria bacterium RBG_16_44_10]
MLNLLRTAVNNPFDLRHFYLLFLVGVVFLVTPLIAISLISQSALVCKPFQIKLAGNLASGEGKIYEFSYNGPNSCTIAIYPRTGLNKNLTLWLYKPDKTIEVVETSSLADSDGKIVTDGERGRYRLSLRNKNKGVAGYELAVRVN